MKYFYMKGHLKSVCMNYYEHFMLSFGFGCKLFIGSIAAFIHALIPDIFTDSTSNLIKDISSTMSKSGCHSL